MKKFLFGILLLISSNYSISQQDTLIFYSSKDLNLHRFANSNLESLTSGYLLDLEEELTKEQLDSLLLFLQKDTTDVNGMLSFMNLLERTDVTFSFERDSLLFPVMDHYYSIADDKQVNIPLYFMDIDFKRLTPSKRLEIDTWTGNSPYNALNSNELILSNQTYLGLFVDSMTHDDLNIYWDDQTILTNTNRTITNVEVFLDGQWNALSKGSSFSLVPYITNGTIENLTVRISLSDATIIQKTIRCFLKSETLASGIPKSDFGDYQGKITGWDSHDLYYTILYGCEDNRLNKPFILVAGWGPYTGVDELNDYQGWPTDENGLYQQWNQAGFIDRLREVGYDVVIARFLPPNADIRKNADKLEILINTINNWKNINGSYEENVILGYSAGAMAVRLTLETMEWRHLNHNGPNPHTKLYISFDGEHQGANIPLAAQHGVEYLQDYQLYSSSHTHYLNIYALHYILNAPLSKQLLKYFYSQTGNSWSPSQGQHFLRTEFQWEYSYHNHDKNTHLPNYPSFSRNISISNGKNESAIYGANDAFSSHLPFPTEEGYVPYKQLNPNRKWHTEFNKAGGNTVFKYEWKPIIGNWQLKIEATTNNQCLVLDNAAGGTVFIPHKQNPLWSVFDMMKKTIFLGNPETYNPHTQFCFTPTLFTHDIRNFSAPSNNFRLNYSMKQNELMYQSKFDADNEIHSNYWGYPHLAYPNSHYWEVTPFDAVFSWSENTEHILFNKAVRDDPYDGSQPWVRVPDYTSVVVKDFILDEADYYNAFIQNKQYGWNARDNYIYKAEIIVPNEIYTGKEVTQRTDFKDAEFLANSDITLQAAKEIHLTPGTNVHSGAIFHAHIEPYHCDYFKSTTAENPTEDDGGGRGDLTAVNVLEDDNSNNTKDFTIFPNPSDGLVNIRNESQKIRNFMYIIVDLNGNELLHGESEDLITSFRAKSGIYIVKIQTHENTYSYKVIVR